MGASIWRLPVEQSEITDRMIQGRNPRFPDVMDIVMTIAMNIVTNTVMNIVTNTVMNIVTNTVMNIVVIS